MGLVKITLCFSLKASAMAYLQVDDIRVKPDEIQPIDCKLIHSDVFFKMLTQHRQSCQQRCVQTQAQTRYCQYTRWPRAGMGPEQKGTPARQARPFTTKKKQEEC